MNEETDSSSLSCDADISSFSSEKENNYHSTLNPILYRRNKVLKEDVINVMKWAEENSIEASKLMFDTIISILKNQTIIQIQIYGIGVLDGTCQKRGPFQLSIAFNLLKYFKEFYEKITITCQEPKLVSAEKEYLRTKNVKILETLEFSSKHFTKVSTNFSNPAFICYMIHGAFFMYEKFLIAHWKPELLSRCIIIGNNPNIFIDPTDLMYSRYSTKLKEFSKLCDSKPLKFEKGSVGDLGIGDKTRIYTISRKNATILIDNFP
uniref:SRR1-like domain-containing protein n=1 Tax=Panagrolaimus sp. PS1159 TaxID=55785 RepID=A0AC35FTC6_9BILA